jgi:signal peptidase I
VKSESETNDATSGGASPSQDPSQGGAESTAPDDISAKPQSAAEPPSDDPTSTADEADASAEASPKGDGAKVSPASATEASEDPPSLRRKKNKREDADKAPLPPMRRGLRTIYWAVWFVLAPFVLACLFVWAATPPSGELLEGGLSFLRSFVREQPVPVGIASLTFFELAFWMARHRLPLASHAYTPLPEGVAENLRSAFERARTLLDEAESILEANKSTLSRDVSNKERQKLRDALDELDTTMRASPFHERSFVDALLRADGEVEVRLGRFRKSEIREYVESIFVAIAVALCLRAFIVEAFKIPSGSMIPTLQVGDHIFVNKFSYGPAIPYTKTRLFSSMPPERGDVMVFAFPEHPEQDFIKRVIALPGDKLEARGGHPILNGWEVPSCFVGLYTYTEGEPIPSKHEGDLFVEFLGDEAYLTLYDRYSGGVNDYQGPYFVKPGEVYVMGDNRNNSHDSRMWFGGQGGGVPFENIKGRALFVWLSVGEQGMAWSRLGAPVMGKPRLPPDMVQSLQPSLEKCFRERPSFDKTNPPAGTGK